MRDERVGSAPAVPRTAGAVLEAVAERGHVDYETVRTRSIRFASV
jgi:hypothetical protein